MSRAGAPTWGIVAMVDEPPQLVKAFVAHHLDAGACALHLFLDRDNPDLRAALAPLPEVHLTVADSAFWQAINGGHRPAHIMRRQARITEVAYARAGVDWLLHCDADEFLADGPGFARLLARQAPDVKALQLRMLERAYPSGAPREGLFDGVFRRAAPLFKDWGEATYGRYAKFMSDGLTGHTLGKGVARTGGTLRLGVHSVHWAKGGIVGALQMPDMLLHFDGLTPRHFLMKLLARAEEKGNLDNSARIGTHRSKQVRFVHRERAAPAALRKFAAGMLDLTLAQIEVLRQYEGLEDTIQFNPAESMARYGLSDDLTARGFEDAMAAKHPDRAALLPGDLA